MTEQYLIGYPGVTVKHRIHPSLESLSIELSALTPDPRNARLHDERNITEVMNSYAAHGQRKPIVVQRKELPGETVHGHGPIALIVRAGNGQLEAAKRLGWTHIAAVIVDENDEEAIKFAIRDNRTAELAEWDWQVVATELANIENAGGSFVELGWNEAELTPLRQTDWFKEATGSLEDHSREKKDTTDDPDSGKEEITITGKDAASFIEAMTLMRERFGEPGMNPGHVVGRLARHYLATVNHSKSPTN